MKKLEKILEAGGVKKDITFLVIGGISLLMSLFRFHPFGFDPAWIAIILCGIPIILEAVIGLVTAFDIKADVLVSLALIASVITGEIFAISTKTLSSISAERTSSYHQQTTDTYIAHILFIFEQMMGIPFLTVSLFHTKASQYEWVQKTNCEKVSRQTVQFEF